MPGAGPKRAKQKDPDLSEEAKHALHNGVRVLLLGIDAVLFLAVVWVHQEMEHCLERMLMPDYAIFLKIARMIFGVAFTAAYFGVAISMVQLFFPRLLRSARRDK